MRSIIVFLVSLLFSVLNAQTEYNKLDSKGFKHGIWKGMYEESKRPRYQGTFEHGKEVGVFQFFDDTQKGDVIATRKFNPKDNSAYTIFYDQNKNKVSEGKVIHKLFEGEWKYYHFASPDIMTIENYKKGKLDGLRTVFFQTEKLLNRLTMLIIRNRGLIKSTLKMGCLLRNHFTKIMSIMV